MSELYEITLDELIKNDHTFQMQVTKNGEKLEQEFTPNEATVNWMDFPQIDKNEYTFRNYKYYDKDGNLIEENE
ncbi:hypothetical protein QUF94_04890 [Peribacillus sp. NJ4]|nr:hypothetical protein [Peribacillus sp. NJ4]